MCALAWAGDPRVKRRTQSSIAISLGDAPVVLVNATPDVGEQIRATPRLWPAEGLRHSPIAAVVLTSGEVDHTAGLLTLRERQPFSLVALPPVHAALVESRIFDVLGADIVPRVAAVPAAPMYIVPSLSIELFPVPGKVPLFLEDDRMPEIGGETGETAGLMAMADGRSLAYVPGCAHLTAPLLERLGEADVVLFDGTLYSDDEMIAAGLGTKTGRRMGHLPIAGENGSLAALAALPGRKIYIHINNTNPVLIEGSPERLAVERAGVEIAFDGMEIVL